MGHFDRLIWGGFVLWNIGMWLCSIISHKNRILSHTTVKSFETAAVNLV